MATRRFFSNVAAPAYLTAPMLVGDLTFATSNTQGGAAAPPTGYPASYPFYIVVGAGLPTEEVMLVSGVSSSTWTVTRGGSVGYGSAASAHATGETVDHYFVANDADDANAHITSSSGVHGLSGALVGVTDVQTLTNKTLTSPTVNGGTVNATVLQQGSVQAATTTDSQTLTNKTLTSPTINSGTLNGAYGGNPVFSNTIAINGNALNLGTSSTTSPSVNIFDNGTGLPIIAWSRSGFLRWYWGPDGGNVMRLGRYDSAGNFQNAPLAIDGATGNIDFPSVIPTAGSVPMVTTTGSQTLTNKTIAGPTITNPTITNGSYNSATLSSGTLNSCVVNTSTVTSATIDAASTIGGVSGTSLAADRTAWTNYTPTLTNLTGGTATAYYKIIGKTMHIRGYITTGTTTATAAVTFSAPGGVTGPAVGKQVIQGSQGTTFNDAFLPFSFAAGGSVFGVGGTSVVWTSGSNMSGYSFIGTVEIA